jgi:hypothetical protein
MEQHLQANLSEERPKAQVLAVRFPLPAAERRPADDELPRLSCLLPRRWRRRVVIQGQRYWLPG